MSAVATSCKPRIWVACLHCYNDGRLVGEWVDCTDAADVTLAQLHGGTGGPYTGCEEVWCLDHENIPVALAPTLIWTWAMMRGMARPKVAMASMIAEARACQFFCVCGLEVGGDPVGVGGGELGEGLFPVGGELALDETGWGGAFAGGFALVLVAFAGAFVLDVADRQPQ